jgi:pyrophosphatase PpaX
VEMVLFDLDGTLIDSFSLVFKGYKKAIYHFSKVYMTDKQVINLFGETEKQAFYKLFGKENGDKCFRLYYCYYKKYHDRLVSIFNGIYKILIKLQTCSIPCGIVTSKTRICTDFTLKELEIENYFETVITGDDVVCLKPSAEPILKAIGNIGTNKTTIMIGDTPADMISAKCAGIIAGAALWGTYDREKLLATPHNVAFDSTESLHRWLFC